MPASQPDAEQPLLGRQEHAEAKDGAQQHSVWGRELKDLLHLAAPACVQLCAQQGLVVSWV